MNGPEPLRVRPGAAIRREDLDVDAVKVIRRLRQNNFVAYLVGGCVRDLLLGRVPKDFDIATEATPRQVKRLFRNSRIIGRRFRLVHITFDGKVFDVSTFRAQAEAPAGGEDLMIRQDNVFGTAGEDARRRDFTINGLFYDVEAEEVIDYVGGLRDLERHVIETIGDPSVRFREDPVRMLRAIKFAGRLHFRLADDVYQAIIDCGADLKKAAAPRIFEEIVRILNRGGAHASLRLMFKTGILAQILPELDGVVNRDLENGRQAWLWRAVAEVDRLVTEGENVSHTVMLSCLFACLFEGALYESQTGAGGSFAELALKLETMLRPIAVRLHMSRRDTFLVKQILLAQRRFLLPSKSRRRKPAQAQFHKRDYFADALQLFRIYSIASDRFADELVRLRS